MFFSDFLKFTVIACAVVASLLIAITVLTANLDNETLIALISFGWWVIAAVIGLVLGRHNEPSTAIAKLLAEARDIRALPQPHVAATIANRLWLLALSTVAAVIVAFWAPQISGIAAGFAIIWAFAWRKQAAAVEAVENRDLVRFFVDKTSPFSAIKLVRSTTPAHNISS